MALVNEGQYQDLKLPAEIWTDVLQLSVDPNNSASWDIILAVIAALSKKFNALIKKIRKEKKMDKVTPDSIAAFCSTKGYLSLLQYVLDNGAPLTKLCIRKASEKGHLDCLKLIEERGCTLDQKELDAELKQAVYFRHPDSVFHHFLNKGAVPKNDCLLKAIEKGNLERVKLIHNESVRITGEDTGYFNDKFARLTFTQAAAQSGNLEVVKFVEQYTPLEQDDVAFIAYGGSTEVLQYYLDKGFHLTDKRTCEAAANVDNFDFIRFAVSRGGQLSTSIMSLIASREDDDTLDLVKEMRALGCPWDGRAIYEARNFEVLQYLVENGCPFAVDGEENHPRKEEATLTAAASGNLKFLQYLMDHNAPWPKNILNTCPGYQRCKPAHDEFTAVVKYLRSRGCAWSTAVPEFAALRGNLELLKYTYENQLPWTSTTVINAIKSENLDCLEYALDHGCPYDGDLMDDAVKLGHSLPILQYAFMKGLPWKNDTCTHLIERGQYDMLVYAHENGAPWTAGTLSQALPRNSTQFSCLKYAVEHGCTWDPQEILRFVHAMRTRYELWVQPEGMIEWIESFLPKQN